MKTMFAVADQRLIDVTPRHGDSALLRGAVWVSFGLAQLRARLARIERSVAEVLS